MAGGRGSAEGLFRVGLNLGLRFQRNLELAPGGGQGRAGQQQPHDDHRLLQEGPGPWPLTAVTPITGSAGVWVALGESQHGASAGDRVGAEDRVAFAYE
jgi:hypothetical protein